MQAHPSRNYISTVISSPNYTSLPSTVATFLTTHLMAVLQPSRYSVFHSGNTPIQLSLPYGVTPVSVSILKLLLRVIEVLPLKL